MLETINTLLTENFGEFGPLLVVGILGLFLILLTLPIPLQKQEDPLDKLREQARGGRTGGDDDKKQKLRSSGGRKDKLEKYSNFLEPADEEEYSAIRLQKLEADRGWPEGEPEPWLDLSDDGLYPDGAVVDAAGVFSLCGYCAR